MFVDTSWSGGVNEVPDLIAALMPVVAALNRLGLRYYVGGSVASSFHGAARSTMDVDVICEFPPEKIADFVAEFGDDFYVSETAIRDAVQRKSCFNLIHLPTSFKVDVFVSRRRPFDTSSMNRATTEFLGGEPPLEVRIATAEDSIISKLEWYRRTNETSERQWDDVTRLIQLLGSHADVLRLTEMAEAVGVHDLLKRLLNACNGRQG
jgi:hypothetical protein